MKKTVIVICCLCLILGAYSLFYSQEEEKPPAEAETIQTQLTPPYNPAGRRDPFRDLLGGRDVQPTSLAAGVPQMSVDDVILTGIVKVRGEYTAIINDGQGFPYYIKEGEKLVDGFVLKIEESRVVFRKTHERGLPL